MFLMSASPRPPKVLDDDGTAIMDNGYLIWSESGYVLQTKQQIWARQQAVEERMRILATMENKLSESIHDKFDILRRRGGVKSLLGVPVDGAVWEWNRSANLWIMEDEETWEKWLRKEERREIRENAAQLRLREGQVHGERLQIQGEWREGRALEVQQRRLLDRARPIARGAATATASARDNGKDRDISRNF